MERCRFGRTRDGRRITGTALVSLDDGPHEIRYTVITDEAWRPVTVGAHVEAPQGDFRMTLAADGEGSWSSADEPLIELFGAVDVDLTWTPATITPALRRLDLAVGERAQSVAARVEFPEHHIARVHITYERLDEHRFRIESGPHESTVEVDADGVVTSFPGRWLGVG